MRRTGELEAALASLRSQTVGDANGDSPSADVVAVGQGGDESVFVYIMGTITQAMALVVDAHKDGLPEEVEVAMIRQLARLDQVAESFVQVGGTPELYEDFEPEPEDDDEDDEPLPARSRDRVRATRVRRQAR